MLKARGQNINNILRDKNCDNGKCSVTEILSNVAGSVIAVSDQIKSLGMVLDKRLSFNAQVDRTCKAIQYHARSFRHIRNSLPDTLARTVASSIVSRLDYCNSLLVGRHRQTSSNYNVPRTASYSLE